MTARFTSSWRWFCATSFTSRRMRAEICSSESVSGPSRTAARPFGVRDDLVGELRADLLDHVGLERPADEPLRAVHRGARVREELRPREVADDDPVARVERDDRRDGVVALARRDDVRPPVLHHRRAGVGRPEVDADDRARAPRDRLRRGGEPDVDPHRPGGELLDPMRLRQVGLRRHPGPRRGRRRGRRAGAGVGPAPGASGRGVRVGGGARVARASPPRDGMIGVGARVGAGVTSGRGATTAGHRRRARPPSARRSARRPRVSARRGS